MRKPPTISPTQALTVLSISPIEEDHQSLQSFFGQSAWKLLRASRIGTSLTFLKRHEVSVVLCERDLAPGETWIDMLENVKHLSHPPSFIVTSRLADDRLWAEALNLGAWDVLAKPFDRIEVLRGLRSAWQHWTDTVHERTVTRMMRAAS